MLYLGVDIGGTNIKLALIEDAEGELAIKAKGSFRFRHEPCGELCTNIRENAERLAEEAGLKADDIAAVGLSVPGSIDQSGEILLHAYNMGYHGVALKAGAEEAFPGRKVVMVNDANAAAMAELELGALRGCRNALLITIGTGVGTGLILDGKVFNGGQNRGCEMGHMPFRNGADPCTCGQSGCLEVYTSATRIARQGEKLLGPEYADSKTVLDAARAGNETAKQIIGEYISDLADVLAGFCCALDPERIALGGGFSAAGDDLYVPLRKLVEERNFNRVPYEIVPAHFLNDAGVMGAALFARLTSHPNNNKIK